MRKLQADVGLHALESSKSGGGALVVIPNFSHVPKTSSSSGYLDGKKLIVSFDDYNIWANSYVGWMYLLSTY